MPKIRIAAALAVLLTSASWARSTTMVYLSLADLNGLADEVVIGRVIETRAYRDSDGGAIFTAVTLEVLETVRGTTSPTQRIVIHHIGGELGGIALRYAGMPHFVEGREVAVFLRRVGTDAFAPVGLAQGVLDVVRKDGVIRAVRGTGSMHFLNARGPGRAPVEEVHPDESYTLEELRDAVRSGPGVAPAGS